MKRLLLFLSLLAAGDLAAMQSNPIQYQPYFNEKENRHEINGNHNSNKIAYIHYESLADQVWHIIEIWVHPDYRNRKIAKTLIHHFFNHSFSNGCKKISWQAFSFDPSGLSPVALVAMYRSLCKTLEGHFILTESPDRDNPILEITNMCLTRIN